MTVGRAKLLLETHPRTSSRMRWTALYELPHTTSSSHPSVICLASSLCQDSRALLSSRAGARSTRSFAPGSLWPVPLVHLDRHTPHRPLSMAQAWLQPHSQ